MQSLPTALSDFLLAFGKDAAVVFFSYFAAYAAASYALLSSAHGNTAAWDGLRTKLHASIDANSVKVCRTIDRAIVQSSISSEARTELTNLVELLAQIDAVNRRLLILHRRGRFIYVGVVLAIIAGVVSASPILFGETSYSVQLQSGVPLFAGLTAFFGLGFYLGFNLRHAEAWSRLQGQAAALDRRLQGLAVDPI